MARDLLGCVLVSRASGLVTAGKIVETEAYLGPEDAASHAAIRPGAHPLLYGEGGHAYVFRAYGMHCCFNAVAQRATRPGCILVRALEPIVGMRTMARRRRVPVDSPRLASGPGNLTRALGITMRDNGVDLTRGRLTIAARDPSDTFRIAAGPRIGITRSVDLPLRFWIAGNRYVSR